MKLNDCDPAEQQLRQDRLEALYEADGRHAVEHPFHGLYTGLVAQAQLATHAEEATN